MTRQEAEANVSTFVRQVAQYQAVSHDDARTLLGDEGFERLRKDAIRRCGPSADTVYPWNVVDWLMILSRPAVQETPYS